MGQHVTIHGKTTEAFNGADGKWIALRTNSAGQLEIARLSGEFPQFNRLGVLNGGVGADVLATGLIRSTAGIIYRIRCVTAGTVKIWDNTSAAGTAILDTTAMTAGQVIELGEITNIGLFATVTSGTYRIVVDV